MIPRLIFRILRYSLDSSSYVTEYSAYSFASVSSSSLFPLSSDFNLSIARSSPSAISHCRLVTGTANLDLFFSWDIFDFDFLHFVLCSCYVVLSALVAFIYSCRRMPCKLPPSSAPFIVHLCRYSLRFLRRFVSCLASFTRHTASPQRPLPSELSSQ